MAFKLNPSTAYSLYAVVKIAIVFCFTDLYNWMPLSEGILISKNKRSTGNLLIYFSATFGILKVFSRLMKSVLLQKFFITFNAGSSSSIATAFIIRDLN